jgi:inorganic pyrophosphatase
LTGSNQIIKNENKQKMTTNNPWHSVSPGKEAPKVVNAIIEIPKGSRAKYELDKESGLLKLDRVLYSSVYYPANYGFIPKTYCDDDDPLDILVLSQVDVVPMCIMDAKVIGVMRMIDGGEADDKIIAVAANDMSVNHINDISELPPHFTAEMRHFFEEYKRLEHKKVEVAEFENKEVAERIVLESIEGYNKKFGNK